VLYLDTSALLKLYINEPGAELVRRVTAASPVCMHLIAYAETRSGLAKAQRMGRIDVHELEDIKWDFERDWERMLIVLPDDTNIRRAGDLSERFSLRGYDSIHLAAAELVFRQHTEFTFVCFDKNLNKAANALGIKTLA